MGYKKLLNERFYILALAAPLLLHPAQRAWADTPISLTTAVEQSLQQPRTFARAQTAGLLGIEAADSLRFAPSVQGDIHHAEGAGVPLRNTIGLDATTMSLELSQPLYRSGQSRAQAQAEDSRLRAEQADKKLQVQSASLLIVNTYLDIQREAAQLDLMRKLSSASQDIQNKETNLAFLRQDLQDLGNVRSDAPLMPVGSPADLPRTLQSALAIMESKHPALAKAIYECAAAEASSRSVKWSQEPGVDLRGALDRTVDSFADNLSEDSGMIGLRATIPFSGDSEQKSRRVQARQSAETSRLNIDETRLKLRQAVISAWDKLTRAHEDATFQQHKARLATEGMGGQLPASSPLHKIAHDKKTFAKLAAQAQLDEIKAKFDIRKAEFALLAATGQLVEHLSGTGSLAAATPVNTENQDPTRLSATTIPETATP